MHGVHPDITRIYYICGHALGAFGGLKFDTFEHTDAVYGTTFWHIISLSEMSKRMASEVKAQAPDLPWVEMERWGDELVKNAPDVDMQMAWQVASVRIQEIHDMLTLRIHGREYYEKRLKARQSSSWFIK